MNERKSNRHPITTPQQDIDRLVGLDVELNRACFGLSHPYIGRLIGRAFQIRQDSAG